MASQAELLPQMVPHIARRVTHGHGSHGTGGPLVTYCSTLLNQHCSPTGFQLAASWQVPIRKFFSSGCFLLNVLERLKQIRCVFKRGH